MKCVCGHNSSKHEWYGDPPKEEQRKWEQRSNEWISKENRPNKLPVIIPIMAKVSAISVIVIPVYYGQYNQFV